MIAILSLGLAVGSIPLFIVCYFAQAALPGVFFGTLGASTATLWCPTLAYVGIRTRSGVFTACGMIGTLATAFWVWAMIYW
jgi:hypothetical protein